MGRVRGRGEAGAGLPDGVSWLGAARRTVPVYGLICVSGARAGEGVRDGSGGLDRRASLEWRVRLFPEDFVASTEHKKHYRTLCRDRENGWEMARNGLFGSA